MNSIFLNYPFGVPTTARVIGLYVLYLAKEHVQDCIGHLQFHAVLDNKKVLIFEVIFKTDSSIFESVKAKIQNTAHGELLPLSPCYVNNLKTGREIWEYSIKTRGFVIYPDNRKDGNWEEFCDKFNREIYGVVKQTLGVFMK